MPSAPDLDQHQHLSSLQQVFPQTGSVGTQISLLQTHCDWDVRNDVWMFNFYPFWNCNCSYTQAMNVEYDHYQKMMVLDDVVRLNITLVETIINTCYFKTFPCNMYSSITLASITLNTCVFFSFNLFVLDYPMFIQTIISSPRKLVLITVFTYTLNK